MYKAFRRVLSRSLYPVLDVASQSVCALVYPPVEIPLYLISLLKYHRRNGFVVYGCVYKWIFGFLCVVTRRECLQSDNNNFVKTMIGNFVQTLNKCENLSYCILSTHTSTYISTYLHIYLTLWMILCVYSLE